MRRATGGAGKEQDRSAEKRGDREHARRDLVGLAAQRAHVIVIDESP